MTDKEAALVVIWSCEHPVSLPRTHAWFRPDNWSAADRPRWAGAGPEPAWPDDWSWGAAPGPPSPGVSSYKRRGRA
jgi:hypothetical protein